MTRFRCGECGWLVTPAAFHPREHCQSVKDGLNPRTRRPSAATKAAAAWVVQDKRLADLRKAAR